MKTKAESAEVLYSLDQIVTVDAGMIDQLKRDALRNPRQRIRLCAHRGVDDPVHEMIIVHTKDAYVRPHRHTGKSESFHVIDGLVDAVFFDESGGITDVIPMGPFSSGRTFFYRIADPLYHTLLIRSDVLVFHEATTGPFRREETSFAPWAPDESDPAAVASFLQSVNERVAGRAALSGPPRSAE
jgi:cupin fold WbuC family metalloprotein